MGTDTKMKRKAVILDYMAIIAFQLYHSSTTSFNLSRGIKTAGATLAVCNAWHIMKASERWEDAWVMEGGQDYSDISFTYTHTDTNIYTHLSPLLAYAPLVIRVHKWETETNNICGRSPTATNTPCLGFNVLFSRLGSHPCPHSVAYFRQLVIFSFLSALVLNSLVIFCAVLPLNSTSKVCSTISLVIESSVG